MKRIVVIFLLMGMVTVTKAQNPLDLIERYSIDTASLVSYIKENKLKKAGIDDCDGLRIAFIFAFEDTIEHSKDEYLDGSFLNSIYLSWHYSNRCETNNGKTNEMNADKILLDVDRYFVLDKNGIILGFGQNIDEPFCRAPSHSNVIFNCFDSARFIYNHKVDIVCRIAGFSCYLFGVNLQENKIYIVVDTRWGAEIFPLEEIINNHWDDFQGGLMTLYDEVWKRKAYEYSLNPEQL